MGLRREAEMSSYTLLIRLVFIFHMKALPDNYNIGWPADRLSVAKTHSAILPCGNTILPSLHLI